MRKINVLLATFVLALMFAGAVNVSAALPSDLNVLMDTTHMDFFDEHAEATGLDGNLTAAGSTFNVLGDSDTFAVGADVDVLLMPNPDVAWSQADLDTLTAWFTGEGAKLLWITADSDFGGYFAHNNTNMVLEELGAKLRFASVSLEDEQNSDGSAYRVFSTGSVTDGKVNAKLNEGVDKIVMHGPTAIAAEVDGAIVNPLTTEVDMVEVVRTSSDVAIGIDGDLSETDYDLYADFNGTMPMVGLEMIDSGKWVMASGEAVFSDYKQMYSLVSEKGEDVDGKTFVDNVLSWFSESGDSDSLAGFLPAPVVPFAFAIAAVVLIRRRK